VKPDTESEVRDEVSLDATAAHARDQGGPGAAVYAPKCVCIVSRWNFRGFRDFLVLLYNLSLSPLPFPLERIVGNFMTEVPLPPAGRVTVQYMVMPDTPTIAFQRPAPNRRVDPWELDYRTVFECLDLDNIVLLLRCMLVERALILHSTQFSLLTKASEVLVSLLYPLRW